LNNQLKSDSAGKPARCGGDFGGGGAWLEELAGVQKGMFLQIKMNVKRAGQASEFQRSSRETKVKGSLSLIQGGKKETKIGIWSKGFEKHRSGAEK